MFKLLEFDGYDQHGPHIFPLELGGGNRHIKLATEMHPAVARYIADAKKIPGKTQLLIDALGAGEWWGCFPAGAPVRTASGESPIESIEVGDEVRSHTGQIRRVSHVFEREYEGDLVGIEISGLPRCLPMAVGTPNHPFYIVRRDEMVVKRRKYLYQRKNNLPNQSYNDALKVFISEIDFDWAPLGEVQVGDYVAQPFPTEEKELPEILRDPDIAVLAGAYAADGCLPRRYDKDMLDTTDPVFGIVIVLGRRNDDVAEKICSIVERFGRSPYVKQEHNHTRIQINWAELARAFRDHIGTPAKDKRLSPAILTAPKGWQENLLEYYTRGDGCVRREKKGKDTIRCVSVSLNLLRDFRQVAARLGYIAQINGRHNKKSTHYHGEPIYTLEICGSQLRKETSPSEGYLHPNGYILSRVAKTWTEEFSGNVYNLEVEEEESYTVNDIAVHNSNKNGDFFGQDQLAHRGKDYGHETFMHYAYPYRHHLNKCPEKAYGDKVILSVYNPTMHRVQLIVAVHNDKCRDIIDQIDSGTYPETSMGCKVPYDSCSYCGNRAKNRSQYCEHLKYQMNRILPDGRKVMAINHRPKFFDISFVLIGAEKASKVLMKVASQNRGTVSSAELGEKYYSKLWKGADLKSAAVQKKGTITKEVPMKVENIEPIVESAPAVKSREPELPPAVMRLLEDLPLSEIFSTLAFLGIDPKPEEFQKIILIKSGQRKLAEDLAAKRKVFDERASSSVDNPEQYFSIDVEHINEKLAHILRPSIPNRSCFNDFLIARLDKYAGESPWYPDERKSSYLPVIPLAAGLAGLYAYMKNKSAEASMTKFDKAILRHPWLFGLLTAAGAGVLAGGINLLKPQPLGSLDTQFGTGYNPHYKTAASKKWLLPLALGPLAYMYSGVQRSRAMRGERLGKFDRFIAERPDIAAIASMIGAPVAASKGARLARHLKLGSIYTDFGLFSLTSGSKLLPAALIGAMVDATVAKKIGKIIDKRSKHGNPEGPAR